MNEKINYKNYGFRIDSKIAGKLKELKVSEGLSYNLLFIKLIEQYENIHRRIHDREESK